MFVVVVVAGVGGGGCGGAAVDVVGRVDIGVVVIVLVAF